MRKFDCICFRITGKTNFKKKVTSFSSKYVRASGEMELWKSKLQMKFAD